MRSFGEPASGFLTRANGLASPVARSRHGRGVGLGDRSPSATAVYDLCVVRLWSASTRIQAKVCRCHVCGMFDRQGSAVEALELNDDFRTPHGS